MNRQIFTTWKKVGERERNPKVVPKEEGTKGFISTLRRRERETKSSVGVLVRSFVRSLACSRAHSLAFPRSRTYKRDHRKNSSYECVKLN